MSGGATSFQAWSLPAGVSTPEVDAGEGGRDRVVLSRLAADPAWLATLCAGLRESAGALADRPVRDLARSLGRAGSRFMDPGDPIRREALDALPGTSGLSPEMAAAVLDGMAADWTEERLVKMVTTDFPDPSVLDGFVELDGATTHAAAPVLCVHVVSGSVPGVGATALLRSLLVKAPTLVKPGRGDVVLPVLLAQAIREEDADLGASLAVVYWEGGNAELESAALEQAEVLTVYGGDETVRSVRALTPVTTRLLAYHHRVSFGVVGRGGLAAGRRHQVASEAAGAVAFFDQRGCVSPQVIFVEEGGEITPEAWAGELAQALTEVEAHLPAGTLSSDEASAVHQVRGTAELLAASGSGARVIHGGARAWTVIYDPQADLGLSCVGRVIRVVPVAGVDEIPGRIASHGPYLQTVAVAGVGEGLEALARKLARVGASRVTAFHAMPFPPAGWHHDGRGALESLVRWVDLER